MTGQAVTAVDLVKAGAIAAGCALAAAFALVALARPPEFDARLAAIEGGVERTARTLQIRGDAPALPIDAVCAGPHAPAIQKVRGALGALATASRLQVSGVEVVEGAKTGDLQALDIRLEASGPYEGLAGLLGGLSTARPAIFIDTVDVVSKTSVIELVVKGRVYCAGE